LVEFIDFIIGIEDSKIYRLFSDEYDGFFSSIKENENKKITLDIYNILTRKIRKVTLVPNRSWKGADSLLGILVRYEDYESAHKRVLKVVGFKPNSPAEAIGFEVNHDYILGTTSKSHLVTTTESQTNSEFLPMEIYVYNETKNTVWSSAVDPLLMYWGKEAYLGCKFGSDEENVLPYLKETTDGIFPGNIDYNLMEKDRLENAKPPTDEEIELIRNSAQKEHSFTRGQRSVSFDLPKEALEQRFKPIYKPSRRKGSCILITKPFTESGISSINNLRYSKTLGNLDEIEDLRSLDKAHSLQDVDHSLKEEEKKSFPLYQSSVEGLSTRENLDTIDSSRTHERLENQSLLSIDNKERKSHDGGCNEKIYSYFSKRRGGDYLIRPADLFDIQEINKAILRLK